MNELTEHLSDHRQLVRYFIWIMLTQVVLNVMFAFGFSDFKKIEKRVDRLETESRILKTKVAQLEKDHGN